VSELRGKGSPREAQYAAPTLAMSRLSQLPIPGTLAAVCREAERRVRQLQSGIPGAMALLQRAAARWWVMRGRGTAEPGALPRGRPSPVCRPLKGVAENLQCHEP
jgi:hypothetical protein